MQIRFFVMHVITFHQFDLRMDHLFCWTNFITTANKQPIQVHPWHKEQLQTITAKKPNTEKSYTNNFERKSESTFPEKRKKNLERGRAREREDKYIWTREYKQHLGLKYIYREYNVTVRLLFFLFGFVQSKNIRNVWLFWILKFSFFLL